MLSGHDFLWIDGGMVYIVVVIKYKLMHLKIQQILSENIFLSCTLESNKIVFSIKFKIISIFLLF